MGLLTNNDAKLFRDYFKEMAKLRGISVYYQYPISKDYSIHSEMNNVVYSDPITIDIIFDENPRVNTLRRLGWVSENNDDKPYIAQLPFDTPSLQFGCVIEIPTTENMDSRRFRVTRMTQLLEYPDSVYCQLAPIFESDDMRIDNDYQNSTFNYINKNAPKKVGGFGKE